MPRVKEALQPGSTARFHRAASCGNLTYIAPADDLQRAIAFIRDRVDAHLSGRSGTWLASYAELVAMAEDSGVPVAALQPVLTSLLGPEGDGEVLDQEEREALIDALVGRWAASRFRDL
jgi:hypothetical protein